MFESILETTKMSISLPDEHKKNKSHSIIRDLAPQSIRINLLIINMNNSTKIKKKMFMTYYLRLECIIQYWNVNVFVNTYLRSQVLALITTLMKITKKCNVKCTHKDGIKKCPCVRMSISF